MIFKTFYFSPVGNLTLISDGTNLTHVILEKEYSNINLDNYSTVFLYDALDMAKFNNLYSKTIYLSDIALNYEEYHTKAPKAITLAKASTNIIKFISLYADFKLPREDTEGEI